MNALDKPQKSHPARIKKTKRSRSADRRLAAPIAAWPRGLVLVKTAAGTANQQGSRGGQG